MDISLDKWFSEMAMEESTFTHLYQMNPLDYSLDGPKFQSFASASYSSSTNFNPKGTTHFNGSPIETSKTSYERPVKQLQTNDWNPCTIEHITPKPSPCSSAHIISFENSSSPPATSQQFHGLDSTKKPTNKVESFPVLTSQGSFEDQNCVPTYGQGTKKVISTTRTPLHAQEHVIAERKRREKLGQRFIALSAIIPCLRKMDKASILVDTIKYLKQLQERVKMLEEQVTKQTGESVVTVKTSHIHASYDTTSSDENLDSQSDQPLPEVEARVLDKNVLIKIHCENKKGCLVKILSEIEKLHLIVINNSVLPFGNSTLDITIVAQMKVEFSMNVKDLVKNLRQALIC